MDVGISLLAGPAHQRTGLQSRNGGLCFPRIQGPAWPCNPPLPPRHGLRLAAVEWPNQKGAHFPKGSAPAGTGPGCCRRHTARWRVPSCLLQGALRPRLGGRGGRWRRPEPKVDGPDRGNMVRKMAPLYLGFMHALTSHFHWIAVSLRCSLWLVAKHTGL